MNTVPLHPMLVHFPMVLVVLLPISAAAAWWAIRRGARPRMAWAVPVAFAAALLVSAFIALRTGQAQEERVEGVVSENVLEQHEEAAEQFLVLSGVLLLVTLVGFANGTVGTSARFVTVLGAVGLIGAGVQVGKAGGELVYRYGAASAYVTPASGGGQTEAPARPTGERNED